MVRSVRRDLRAVSSARRAAVNRWFFKTGPGDYGEGDRFLGIAVPDLRRDRARARGFARNDVLRLLRSKWHEERLLALLILVRQYARADERGRRAIHRLYLGNTRWINSWDLVDASAAQIVGAHLEKARAHTSPASRAIEVRMGAAHRDDRDLALHQERRLRRRARDRRHARQGRARSHSKAVGWMLRKSATATGRPKSVFCGGTRARCREPCCDTRSRSFRTPLRRKYLGSLMVRRS